ncbi:asparaginase [Pseudomonas stutzeri]|uniref:asparaginase n=1 Tax=Stutzerimonas stutzeri KOS6 TaxID=1218352 RepID=A0A061JK01_STUST|nr:asparaginase [Stutzerimonas stutzeri]EWC39757.1 asparaginase [Stutzerimonas stutzeri KOS6]MBK3869133.1 asparaginase [Stutzerimonas stutzeri]
MNQSIERLLVLYTGGTIGMQQSAAGLMPASGFEARLRAQQAGEPGPLPEWSFQELQPLLDSANMQPGHWLQMATTIREAVAQGDCDAVLLLHGTDTLAYSAAALSFLLLGLPVPVLLTGAMLPAGSEGSDAWPNLFGAMRVLQAGQVHGVQLFFNGTLLHGARVSKLRSDAFDAFAEAPRQRLAATGRECPPALLPRRPAQVVVLPLYPGIGAAQVQALVASGAQALLLECYGSGTGPADDVQFIEALRHAHRQGVVLAAISQCPGGHVDFGVYAAGSALRDAGLVSGGGMTREAALGKLFALLAAGLDQAQVEYWFCRDLCGEMAD